jgi:hypothetical protein
MKKLTLENLGDIPKDTHVSELLEVATGASVPSFLDNIIKNIVIEERITKEEYNKRYKEAYMLCGVPSEVVTSNSSNLRRAIKKGNITYKVFSGFIIAMGFRIEAMTATITNNKTSKTY